MTYIQHNSRDRATTGTRVVMPDLSLWGEVTAIDRDAVALTWHAPDGTTRRDVTIHGAIGTVYPLLAGLKAARLREFETALRLIGESTPELAEVLERARADVAWIPDEEKS